MQHLALRVLRVLGLPEEDVVEGQHDGGQRHAEDVDDDGQHANGLLVALAVVVERVQHHLVRAGGGGRAQPHAASAGADAARRERLARHRALADPRECTPPRRPLPHRLFR